MFFLYVAVSVLFCDSTISNTRVETLNSGLSAHQKQFFISSVHLFSSRHGSLRQNGKSINYIYLCEFELARATSIVAVEFAER